MGRIKRKPTIEELFNDLQQSVKTYIEACKNLHSPSFYDSDDLDMTKDNIDFGGKQVIEIMKLIEKGEYLYAFRRKIKITLE